MQGLPSLELVILVLETLGALVFLLPQNIKPLLLAKARPALLLEAYQETRCGLKYFREKLFLDEPKVRF